MLLVHPVNELLSFLPALIGVFLLGRAQDDGLPWQIQAAIVAVPVLLGILRYFTTTYRITPEQLQLRRGLVQRATLTAPVDRVRTVDVTAPPLHRVLGLAKVQIGTGAGAPVELDGLSAEHAARLRVELLHRVRARDAAGVEGAAPVGPVDRPSAGSGDPDGPFPEPSDGRPVTAPLPEPEVVLGSFQPSWIRFAPFTFSGWVTALAVWGFLSQFGNDLLRRAAESVPGRAVEAHLASAAWWTIAIEALLVLMVLITLLSVTAYVLGYWGYRLTRHAGGTLHVARGLLTTRAVSIEEARVRGIVFGEPMLLRLVGAARLTALLTGAGATGQTGASGRAMLTPPAPEPLVRRVGADVLGTAAPLTVPLVAHGPAAQRRRYSRAVLSGLAILACVGVPAWLWNWYEWVLVASAMPLLTAPLLGAHRYAALGHAVADGHLVSRSGLFPRQTDVLVLTGVIGWNVEASFFQRRVGLVTLVATTAAGEGAVRLTDVPTSTAYELVGALTPRLAAPFAANGVDRLPRAG